MLETEPRILESMLSREDRNREVTDLFGILRESLEASPGYKEVISSPSQFVFGPEGTFYYLFDDDSLHVGFVSEGVIVELHSHIGARISYKDGKDVTRDTVMIRKGDELAHLSQVFRDGVPYDSHFNHKSADKQWMLDKPCVSADILGLFESLKAS